MTHASLTVFIGLAAPRLRSLKSHLSWKITAPEMMIYLHQFPQLENLNVRLQIVSSPPGAAPVPALQLPRLVFQVVAKVALHVLVHYHAAFPPP